ncbi:MAG: PH domain-containing protein [Candidatus Aenigmarchaeota archaeon]|nr:PH domain-containing protein [Candidatus Aenigmarchaeota archaeon]
MKNNEIKTSRKKFIHVYVFIIAVILLYPSSDFYIKGGIYNTIFISIIVISVLYIELSIMNTKYIIKKDNITEIRGIITKTKTTIPMSSVSHISMKKNIFGMIIDFGDVIITSFTGVVIVLEGISRPDEIHKILQDNVEHIKNNHF